MNKLRVLDLFCGTGGFSKGFENEGSFQVVFGIDVSDVAIETFRANHPAALSIAQDIRSTHACVVSEQIKLSRGEIDVIIAGPPCQGFSSIRPHRSSERQDPRNDLFRDFAAYIDWFRPPLFVLENVVGLATFNGGQTLEVIRETFHHLGYETDWRILNSAHFGVPQKRERLIMLGGTRGLGLSFPQPSHCCEAGTIGFRDRSRMVAPAKPDLFSLDLPLLPPAVSVADAIDDLPALASGGSANDYTRPPRTPYQSARRANSKSLVLHSSTAHTPRMLEIIRHSGPNISHIPRHLITSGFSSCYSRLAEDEPSVTITVNFVHPASNRCIHPTQDRALTPREGARLQSFDDSFMFYGNRAQIVKQIGNAVPPVLGQAIASHISEILGARDHVSMHQDSW